MSTKLSLLACSLITLVACSRPAINPAPDINPAARQDATARILNVFASHGSRLNGRNWSYTLSFDAFEGEPTWGGPGTGQPPLSMEEAIEITRHELPKYPPAGSNWTVVDAELDSLEVR